MLAEEAGVSDFLVATAGHGDGAGTSMMFSNNNDDDDDVLVSTSKSDCYVSGRTVTDGSLLWRRNVCSKRGVSTTTAMSSSKNLVATLDSVGVLRGWSAMDGDGGALLFDSHLPWMSSSVKSVTLEIIHYDDHSVMGAVGSSSGKDSTGDVLSLHSVIDGSSLLRHQEDQPFVQAEQILTMARVKKSAPSNLSSKMAHAKVVSFFQTPSTTDTIVALVAWVFPKKNAPEDLVTTFSNMAIVHFTKQQQQSSTADSHHYYDLTKVSNLKITPSHTPLSFHSLALSTTAHGKLTLAGMTEQDDNTNTVLYATNLENAAGGSTVSAIPISNPIFTTLHSFHFLQHNPNFMALSAISHQSSASTTTTTEAALVSLEHTTTNNAASFVQLPSTSSSVVVAVDMCPHTSTTFYLTKSKENAFALELLKNNDSTTTQTLSLTDILQPHVHGDIDNLTVHCSTNTTTTSLFITTTGGTSVMINLSPLSNNDTLITIQSSWLQEESLASITGAVFLDSSSLHVTEDDENDEIDRSSFFSRLQLQLQSLRSFLSEFSHLHFIELFTSTSLESRRKRDVKFGFAKVAVLLSKQQRTGRLFGMDTLKGRQHSQNIAWSLLLHPDATNHQLVHGGTTTTVGGVALDTSTSPSSNHDVLLLSTLKNHSVEYKCIDGIRGRVHNSGVLTPPSPVLQIVPVHDTSTTTTHQHHHHGKGFCRQVAMLLLEDGSVMVVPDKNEHAYSVVKDLVQSKSSRNGIYAHTIDKTEGNVRSYRIVASDDNSNNNNNSNMLLSTQLLGETSFQGEEILQVAYPQRGEVVTSPATILGDDSLLLKYLNPHLAVVVTHRPTTEDNNDEAPSSVDPFALALLSGSTGSTTTTESSRNKKKPTGVTQPGSGDPTASKQTTASSTTLNDSPNLFINLVDTVSSRILYRISHAHASPTHPIPVSLSENWIVYTYFNTYTRRTDIGVLTLHEGMVDKHGITAFHTQMEQDLDFSSFASEKPIVLQKVFTLGQPKGVRAIGVTQTARGISSKHFLFALGSSQVMSVDRRWLDPRRPSGQPKKSEMVEGLQRYMPMLPFIPQHTSSYSLTVEGVNAISTTAAHVESHSLVLAHGGPDIFVTRISPSKGFDMLPDSFNKGVLSLVVLALLSVLVFLRQLNNKKTMAIAWS